MRKLHSHYLLHPLSELQVVMRIKDDVFDRSILEDSLCSRAKKMTSIEILC